MSCAGNCSNCAVGCISGCNVVCLTSQHFCGGCNGESQNAIQYFNFTHSGCLGRDEIIIKSFPAAMLDSWGQYVEQAAKKGAQQDSGGWSWKGADTPWLRGADITELSNGINSLGGGSNSNLMPGRDDIIYGNDFNDLQTVLDTLQLNPTACEHCNSSCDIYDKGRVCNTCQVCVVCNNQSSWGGAMT